MIRPVTAHKINDHVLCPIEFHGSPTWWKTGSPESFLGCPNYFGLSKKNPIVFLVMNTKLHRNVLLVQMRLSIMLNSSIHAIVRRLLKTWNRRAPGLLNLGEGRARGIRRQSESEWIPVPWNALEILQSYTNPSKWVCQFTCRSCVWSLLCLIGSLFALTSNLCNATPLCGESTGDWLIPLRQRLKSSMIWDAMTLKWRHCIMRSRVCMYTYRYTDTEIEGRTMSKLKSIMSSSCTEFNCWGANTTGWHHYINLHGDNSHRAKRINVKTF